MKDKIITQIGSLPYKDVKQAVRYSLKHHILKHHIHFLPELPYTPIIETENGLPGE